MTWIRMINPRNLLIVLCIFVLVLIGFKGYYIVQKIEDYEKAEQHYAKKQWIEALGWYEKVKRNGWIHYREDEVAMRLAKLAPIQEIKVTFERIQQQAADAVDDLDFPRYMEVSAELSKFRSQYIDQGNPYEKEYRKLSEQYQMSPMIVRDLNGFRDHFTEQMAINLEHKEYEDESFKGYLLQIPDYIYGGTKKKEALLSKQFQAYDERKLAQLGAAGDTNALFQSSQEMLRAYQDMEVEAPWVREKTDEIALSLLEKSAEQDNYSAYIVLAKRYEQYMDGLSIKRSKVKTSIDNQIRGWLRSGERLVQKGDYDAAMKIYKGLADYTDTKALIKQTEIGQAASDPARLLKQGDEEGSYEHVLGGKDRFGGKVYAIGVRNGEHLVIAVWDGEDQVKRIVSDSLPASIRSLYLEKKSVGSTDDVIVAEADSSSRAARFIGFELVNNRLELLFDLEGDRYEIVTREHIKLYHPAGQDAAEAVANYQLLGQQFQFSGYDVRIMDIQPEALLEHVGETVRMTVNVVSFNDQIALAEVQEGQFYIGLYEAGIQQIGTYTVTGKMNNHYIDVQYNDSVLNVPLVEVTKVE